MVSNAILVANHEAYRKSDFLEIAAEMRRIAPDIRSYVAWKDVFSLKAEAVQLLRPTLSIMLSSSTRYRRLRGAVARSTGGGKIPSYRILDAAGLPVPPWTEVTPATRLDPSQWGEWVVLKPARGKRGQGVVIARAEEVRYQPPESYPEGHAGRLGPMIAQRYVFTGPWPVHYRVTTCFGRPLFLFRYELKHELQAPLADPADFGDGQPRSIPTSPRGGDDKAFTCDGTLAYDADMLDLGRRIHAALPNVPLIGADLLRDQRDGSLWISEVNQSSVWGLSGDRADAWRARGLDGYGQFGAIRVAAEAMVEATRRLAR